MRRLQPELRASAATAAAAGHRRTRDPAPTCPSRRGRRAPSKGAACAACGETPESHARGPDGAVAGDAARPGTALARQTAARGDGLASGPAAPGRGGGINPRAQAYAAAGPCSRRRRPRGPPGTRPPRGTHVTRRSRSMEPAEAPPLVPPARPGSRAPNRRWDGALCLPQAERRGQSQGGRAWKTAEARMNYTKSLAGTASAAEAARPAIKTACGNALRMRIPLTRPPRPRRAPRHGAQRPGGNPKQRQVRTHGRRKDPDRRGLPTLFGGLEQRGRGRAQRFKIAAGLGRPDGLGQCRPFLGPAKISHRMRIIKGSGYGPHTSRTRPPCTVAFYSQARNGGAWTEGENTTAENTSNKATC